MLAKYYPVISLMLHSDYALPFSRVLPLQELGLLFRSWFASLGDGGFQPV